MAQLVRQHGLHLVDLQPGQQGVEEDDAPALAEAGEVGVAMGRAAAAVHHEQAAGTELAARQQRQDAFLDRSVGQRLEAVEERGNDGGKEQQHHHVEADPEGPGPQPPALAGVLHQRDEGRQQRQAQQGANEQRLQVVGHEERRRHAVEAEAGFQPEMPPPVHRQLGQADEKQRGAHDEQLLQERLVGQPAHPGFVDELQAAQ